MRAFNVVLAGVGGQGILFASRILFESAMAKGQKVMGAETHGMSQRGGSVVSHFKMGDNSSSMVIPGTADALVALERTEGLRNLEFLRPGGVYLVNAPDLSHLPASVGNHLETSRVKVLHVDADGLALAAGKPLTSNLYVMGFFCALPDVPFDGAEVRAIVAGLSKGPFADDNLKAFDAGLAAAAGRP
jgi:indolepyruvate ferredoxin oxidoreductase beta subunit